MPRCCQVPAHHPHVRGLHLKRHTAVQQALQDQLLFDGMEPLRAFRETGEVKMQSHTHPDK